MLALHAHRRVVVHCLDNLEQWALHGAHPDSPSARSRNVGTRKGSFVITPSFGLCVVARERCDKAPSLRRGRRRQRNTSFQRGVHHIFYQSVINIWNLSELLVRTRSV